MNSFKQILNTVSNDVKLLVGRQVNSIFYVELLVGSVGSFHGSGANKKAAENQAAEEALRNMRISDPVLLLYMEALKVKEEVIFQELGQVTRNGVQLWRCSVKCGTKEGDGEGRTKSDARASAATSLMFPTKDSQSPYMCSVKKSGMEKKDKAWLAHFEKCQTSDTGRCADVLLLGDSIIANFKKWSLELNCEVANFSFGGEKIEHCLQRVIRGRLPSTVKLVVLHIGTNNVSRDDETRLVDGVVQICEELMQRLDVDILVSSLLPRRDVPVKKINAVNHELHNAFNGKKYRQIYFVKHPKSKWCETQSDGSVVIRPDLLKSDGVHPTIEKGYRLFMESIKEVSRLTACELPFKSERQLCSKGIQSTDSDPFGHLAFDTSLSLVEKKHEFGDWDSQYRFNLLHFICYYLI